MFRSLWKRLYASIVPSNSTAQASASILVAESEREGSDWMEEQHRGRKRCVSSEEEELEGQVQSVASTNSTSVNQKRRCYRKAQPLVRLRRRTRGADAALRELAGHIVQSKKNVVIITGAGLSVASGIRPFRSNPNSEDLLPAGTTNSNHVLQEGLWNDVVWTMATRETFRKDPVKFYNQFWIPHFVLEASHKPNAGHHALQALLENFSNIKQITQNIDGLQKPRQQQQLIEVHGRAGLFKCCPDSDSDSSDESDNEDDRPVQLGHRRKSQWKRERLQNQQPNSKNNKTLCPYQYLESLTPDQLILRDGTSNMELVHATSLKAPLSTAPCCPVCGNKAMPQALLFDEGYHSHSFYQFETVEDWLLEADVVVFVGTSLGAVRLTQLALEHARENQLPVYNFNLFDVLTSTSRLNVSNIVGNASETLPKLVEVCRRLQEEANAV